MSRRSACSAIRSSSPWWVSVSTRATDDLRTSFNSFLAEIKKNGVYNEMVERWINKRETKMPEIPRKPPTGSIIAGISTGGAPFTFIQDNVLLGFDIEMLNRFGASIGKDIKYSDMEFGGLVAAVATAQGRPDRRLDLHHRGAPEADQFLGPVLREGQSRVRAEEQHRRLQRRCRLPNRPGPGLSSTRSPPASAATSSRRSATS